MPPDCECGHGGDVHCVLNEYGVLQPTVCQAHVDEKVDGSPIYCDCQEFKEKKL